MASYFLSVVLPSCGLPEKAWYNASEVAFLLGVSRRTLDRMIADNRLRVVQTKRGGKKMVHYRVLVDYFSRWDDDKLGGNGHVPLESNTQDG